jgi:hypothetical protein
VSIGQSLRIRLGSPAYQDGEHVISVYENVVLTYSSEAPNPSFLEAWTRAVDLVAAQFSDGLLALTIISRHARPPSDVSRLRIRNTVLRHATHVKAFAYVVEGEGLAPRCAARFH